MKGLAVVLSLLAANAAAAPVDKRQFDLLSSLNPFSSDELDSGSCKEVIFIFARGSMEPGNMGIIIGPETCSALKGKLGSGKVACQGVGGDYTASMFDNASLQFTSQAAINEAKRYFTRAVQKCPNAKIVFGGYSQGGAVMHGAVSGLDANTRNRLVGGVLFGDSMNGRNSGRIPNYPADRVKELCNDGDGICATFLYGITSAHLTYGMDGSANEAATFLAQKVNGGGFPSTSGGGLLSGLTGGSSLLSGLMGGSGGGLLDSLTGGSSLLSSLTSGLSLFGR